MNKKRDPIIGIDRETHRELKILAATKSVSIKQCLKELVEREKARSTLSQKPDFSESGKTWNEDLERWE